ncbi:ribosomal RNA-processing protein 7-domain-containing protein [Paraphysoderma sedebokerense]|nr:ribosomal RNA-processing protein 7-domain-containing protein [Paraphysoderma sedebokerense]
MMTNIKSSKPKGTEKPSLVSLPNGFHILPVHVPTKLSKSDFVVHQIFIKEHSAAKPNFQIPDGRTLFVLNVPIDATAQHMKHLFRNCGKIERVEFKGVIGHHGMSVDMEDDEDLIGNEKATELQTSDRKCPQLQIRELLETGGIAYVVFKSKKAIERALTLKQKKRVWSDSFGENEQNTNIPPLGIVKFLREHQTLRPDHAEHQLTIDQYMENYEASERAAQEALSRKHNTVDEDGFILVTRKSRRNTNTDGKVSVTAAKSEDVKKLKPKKKELDDFYRFQMREAKRSKLLDLRKRFEEDKKRIQTLRESRKFKPY